MYDTGIIAVPRLEDTSRGLPAEAQPSPPSTFFQGNRATLASGPQSLFQVVKQVLSRFQSH